LMCVPFFFVSLNSPPHISTPFPYTTLFRSRDHCKNVLLDTLACAVAGHRGEETQQLAALASGLAQSTESSVIGGDRLSLAGATIDRKSTRLNSSHLVISYAVFCLKKKNKQT